jgi:hypothetical protein
MVSIDRDETFVTMVLRIRKQVETNRLEEVGEEFE